MLWIGIGVRGFLRSEYWGEPDIGGNANLGGRYPCRTFV
jgi:hypothetical protein